MTTTTELLNAALVAGVAAQESGNPVHEAILDSITGANENQKDSVLLTLDRENLADGIFDKRGLGGAYGFVRIDRITEKGVERSISAPLPANQLSVKLTPLAVEVGEFEPLQAELSEFILDSAGADLSPDLVADLTALRDALNAILMGPEPDQVLVRRLLVVLRAKGKSISEGVAASGIWAKGAEPLIDLLLSQIGGLG